MKKRIKNPPLYRVPGRPQGEDDLINKYGTFEVQATCGMENEYPSIAQGLAKEEREQYRNGSPEA